MAHRTSRYFIDDEAECSDDSEDNDYLWQHLGMPECLREDCTPIIDVEMTPTEDEGEGSQAPTATTAATAPPPATPAPATRGWRLQAKNLFLTFPQCPTAKETVMQNVKNKFGTQLSWCVVAQETHEDGAPHLHVCIALKSKYRSTLPSDLDCCAQNGSTTYHGNYQAMRNQRSSLEYVQKEDKEPLAWGIDITRTIAKKNGKAAWIATMVQKGASLAELVEEDPGFMLQHQLQVRQFMKLQTILGQAQRKSDTQLTFSLESGDLSGVEIVAWLTANIRKPRQFKQAQLWIYSPPNMGKTSLILALEQHLSIYWAPLEGTHDDMYENGTYDLVVFDEYHGQRRMTWLNWFLQGGTMPIHRRYESVNKTENLPVIILSNYTPQECYKNMSEEQLAPLLARLKIVVLTQFIKIAISVVQEEGEEQHE